MDLSLQIQKADSFRFAPSPYKFTVLKAFLGYVRSSELAVFSLRSNIVGAREPISLPSESMSRALSLAVQVSLVGRIWVIPEAGKESEGLNAEFVRSDCARRYLAGEKSSPDKEVP